MFVLFILCLSLTTKQIGVRGSVAEKKLIRDLFVVNHYNPIVRPAHFENETVTVYLTLDLYQLIAISEKAQTMEVSVWLSQRWTDHHLEWNPKDYNGIKEINLPPSRIWLPDIVLWNNIHDDNKFGGKMDQLSTQVKVNHTGGVLWITPAILKCTCLINVRHFPFDTQHCNLVFGSWTYDKSKLDIKRGEDNIVLEHYIENNEWKLTKTEAVRTETVYDCCPIPLPDITFHMHLARRSLYYVLNLAFPITVMGVLTTLTFILPEASSERISLSTTLMLAVIVFMLLVAETTPATSDALPLISVYFTICMLLMFIMIVVLCYVSTLYNKVPADGPMGAWTRRFILNKLSYTIGIRHRHSYPVINNKHVGVTTATNNVTSNSIRQKNDDGRATSNPSYTGDVDMVSELKQRTVGNNVKSEGLKQIESILRKLQSKGSKAKYLEEYRTVAMTIDRLMFIFFLSMFIVSTIGCFCMTTYVS